MVKNFVVTQDRPIILDPVLALKKSDRQKLIKIINTPRILIFLSHYRYSPIWLKQNISKIKPLLLGKKMKIAAKNQSTGPAFVLIKGGAFRTGSKPATCSMMGMTFSFETPKSPKQINERRRLYVIRCHRCALGLHRSMTDAVQQAKDFWFCRH